MTRPIRRKKIRYWVELPDKFFETKRGFSSVMEYRTRAKAHRKAVALLDQHPVVYVTRFVPAINGGEYIRRWEYKRIR